MERRKRVAGKAEQYAAEALRSAERYRQDWNYGNAIQKGHLALGPIALRGNGVEQAKRQLLLAGKSPGLPQLDSFGPNMVLAKKLLEAGERDAVLEYLEMCGEFWVSVWQAGSLEETSDCWRNSGIQRQLDLLTTSSIRAALQTQPVPLRGAK